MNIEASDSEPEKSPLDPVTVFRTSTGDIVVADGNEGGLHRFLVFDEHGTFRRHIRSQGKGPCEFTQLWWAEPYRGDSIAAWDIYNETVAVLSLDGRCSRNVILPAAEISHRGRVQTAAAVPEGVYPDGTMLVGNQSAVDELAKTGPTWVMQALRRVELDGARRDSLGVFRWWEAAGEQHSVLGYAHMAVRALDGFDLLFGDALTFQIQRYDSLGSLSQIVRRPFTPQPLTHDDKIAGINVQRSAMSNAAAGSAEQARPESQRRTPDMDERIARARWAETKPAYSALLVDSLGNIWVEEYRLSFFNHLPPDPQPVYWSVFTREGKWLGRVEVPARLFVKRIYHDMLFGIWRDEDGVGSVRAYALIKPMG